jgi:hypothetical protein
MELSVVIAAGGDAGLVRRCLRSLEQAGARGRCEVIVAGAGDAKLPTWVRRLEAPVGTPYPVLRAAGLAAAEGLRVAMLSEDYTVDERWLSCALAEHLEADVVAGVTRPPPDARPAARAAWLWEYAHLAPPMQSGPLPAGEAALTPGGNAVYRRDRVDPELLRAAHHEIDYHRRLFAKGLRFERDPGLAAVYNPPPIGDFLRDRARWSTSWARPRARELSAGLRWTAAASRIALPPVLLGRFALRVGGKPGSWPAALAGLPLFASFACAQAYGEARAYLDG